MSESLEARVVQVVADTLGVEPSRLDANSTRESFSNWDSVNMINLMMALESELDVRLSVDEATDLTSIPRILKILREKGCN